MSNFFSASAGGSSPPSTPDRNARGGRGSSLFSISGANDPSTTPAGPPPSAASFTPAGAPSDSYLGSSILRGVTSGGPKPASQPPAQPSLFGSSQFGASSVSKNLFAAPQKHLKPQQTGPRRNTPLGRSIHSSKPMKSSKLKQNVFLADSDDEDEEDEEEEKEVPVAKPATFSGSFTVPYDDTYDEGDEDEEEDDIEPDAEGEDYDEPEENQRRTRRRYLDDDETRADAGEDMWLAISQRPDLTRSVAFDMGDESDLMMLNTPAATDRVRKEAEDLYLAAVAQAGARSAEQKYAATAKDMYTQLGTAPLTEPPELIMDTEDWISKLYDEGVGEDEDEDKLDDALAAVAGNVAALWKEFQDELPQPDEEHAAEIGPGPHASPFEKANYLANLALQVHHTRRENQQTQLEPLPETLFGWLSDFHNLYPDQVQDILRHRPSPASHSLFWQTVFICLLRGKVQDAVNLLGNAGWSHVKKGASGPYLYSGKVLENVESAVNETMDMLQSCPGFDGKWEIFNSDWTMFRVRAHGALEQLRSFAEGKSTNELGDMRAQGRQSLAGLARKAESRVPWEIYENLNVVFEIVLGSQSAILDAAQDWCEATIGLFGWWDERRTLLGKTDRHGKSMALSRSQVLTLARPQCASDAETYLDRLSRAFHLTVESEFQVNALNHIEVGMACVFEDNAKGLIGILRSWSLPIASAVAEIASLGKWLPPRQPGGLFGLDDLDQDDLEVLGLDGGSPDEADGIKDSTLIQYAQALADYDIISAVQDRHGVLKDGWELAINVLGRMDSPERSEEIVGSLIQHLLENLDVDSGVTVGKIWRILNELGMIPYAEETAETYGDILARDSHRYGEAMWYYALAHRPNKVREVMNLLISHCLVQSTAYPPPADLDEHLHRLLADRNKTLEQFAKQDLEAAELLGKMLSGYASLRQFYDLRDGDAAASGAGTKRQQAAMALISVIASSDDNIRGGLFDQTRAGIVSEDFLLALLGEALVFVSDPDSSAADVVLQHSQNYRSSHQDSAPAISLAQMHTLLKAVEDLEAVGPRVYSACDEFLQLVLASAPGGLKGSTPADLLRRSTNYNASGSFMLSGSSMLATQLQKSIGAGSTGIGKLQNVRRAWDWRTKLLAGANGEDVIRRIRLGLAKDLAGLWLAEADGGIW